MRVLKLILVIISTCQVLNLILCEDCCSINSRELPRYKLIKMNARSSQPIIARTRVRSLDKCREFASSKKALAFNIGTENDYVEPNARNRAQGRNAEGEMCQALQCPEIHNFTTLVIDKSYKYYSMYPSYIISEVGTLACVPKTGIFVLSSNSLNYSQAQATCQQMDGSLAHVISEARTNGLARFVSADAPTIVGLTYRADDATWKNEFDESISCFEYRAWGKGEPSHSRGCVGLVQSANTTTPPFWVVVPCSLALPFICEISPMY